MTKREELIEKIKWALEGHLQDDWHRQTATISILLALEASGYQIVPLEPDENEALKEWLTKALMDLPISALNTC